MFPRSAEFDGQTVHCRACGARWPASRTRPYYKATTTTDGICRLCLINPQEENIRSVKVIGDLL